MKFLVIFVLVLNLWNQSAAQNDEVIQKAFNNWISKYTKKFPDNATYTAAYNIFLSTYKASSRQQLKYYNGESKFLMKTNKHSIDDSYLKAATRGLILDSDIDFTVGTKENSVYEGRVVPPSYPTPPASLDYRTMGYVSSVKDQGPTCSSCYAFASSCALEGQIFKKYGTFREISPQNIIDCSYNATYGNYGCGGGSMGTSFKYVVKNPGVANETVYPYTGTNQACSYSPTMLSATAKAYYYITGTEAYLKSALAAIGPLAVGVRSDLDSFLYYSSGIYDDPLCDATINHAMCLVGYGTDTTVSPPVDYWILKNSWSADWGESGYMRLQMGSSVCGISAYTVYPTV